MKTFLLIMAFICGLFSLQGQNSSSLKDYIIGRFITPDGREVIRINVPGKPPDNFRMPPANATSGSVILTDVPGYDWSFGCSPTAAAMMAGYYDRTGYPNMYTGPTNGGVAPLDNSTWGEVVISGEIRKQCPISATRNGVDGRNTRGHVDDYWIVYNSLAPDPYITNGWTQHPYGDCTADYMYSNQYVFQRCDGATGFTVNPDGSPMSVPASWNSADGMFGLSQFFISRGYPVVAYYTQYIYGYQGNTLGFNFTQYKQEINAGRPVLIQLAGHTMLGYGYDDAGNTVYLHDTWDYSMHTMTWGGSYSTMAQWGVGVIQLSGSPVIPPTVSTTAVTCNGPNTATAGGIAYDGGDTITVRGVCWGTLHDPTIAGSKTNDGGGEGRFTSTLSGLTANTTYYYRAYATNTLGTSYGLEFTLTTAAAPVLPNVTTSAIININPTFAASGGSVSCDGGSFVTSKGVCWSTSTAPTTANDKTVNGSGMGSFTSNITGLAGNTTYHVRAYATSTFGTAYGNELDFTTLAAAVCSPVTVNHQAGIVSPVNKTVTYGTIANIPGSPAKCWITSNLGADNQATAVNDASETSAGWYWQFNRKQGYKHNGATRTPNSAWITSIQENSDWEAANDPCSTELGCRWHIPTTTEWNNARSGGGWTEWNGPWNSALKMHAAGMLNMGNGSLSDRGVKGSYWSSLQIYANGAGDELYFNNANCFMTNYPKTVGFSVRCIKNTDTTVSVPTVITTVITNIGMTSANSGGMAQTPCGTTVSARGVCWSTSAGPTIANSKTTDGSGAGSFTSSITGLTSYTMYYVRAYATNSLGTGYGNEEIFYTLLYPVMPDLYTTAVLNITDSSATSGGCVTYEGGTTVTSRGVCWSTSPAPTIANSKTINGSGMGAFTSNLTGLTGNTLYYVRAYATNSVGTAYGTEMSFTTLTVYSCPSLSINHVAGTVAPVNKTVTYGTIANLPGEVSKCWITSNLGATHQANSVNDTTEASAGWYWQFNRKQGYKHNGTTRTPSTNWITSIAENLDWEAANDPCALELGCGWRLPTSTEWTNVNASGGWTNWNGPWNSALKIHAAGMLGMNSGYLSDRGVKGIYWSSNQQFSNGSGWILWTTSTSSYMSTYPKTAGFPVRCLKNLNGTTTTPTVTTSPVLNVTQNTASSGGNVTADGGCPVTMRGVCWGTSPAPTTAGNTIMSGTGTGTYGCMLTGLTSNTTYYLRAFATNSNGTVYGNEISFVTLASVTTGTVTGASQTSAMVDGTIAVGGGAAISSRGICWSTITGPTIAGNHTSEGSGTGVFYSFLTGLSPSTFYYIRAYGTNGGGTSYGDQFFFWTTSPIQLDSPNGGETWLSGTVHPITWTSANVVNVSIAYTIDNGANWTTIIASTPALSGSYSWNVPNPSPTVASVNCKVKVTSTANTNAFDMSDGTFTILSALKHAPVTYTDTIGVAENTPVSVPVKVDKFRKITALSLRLDYNPLILNYVGSGNMNGTLSGLIISNISVSPTLSKVMITWSDLTPTTLPNGSKVVDILFTHLTGATDLIWNNTNNIGQDCEYADSIGNPLIDNPTSLFFRNGEVHTFTGWPVNGLFTYNNSANTPLDSLWVILRQDNIRIDSVQTTLSGAYTFSSKANGVYTLSARTNKTWSSVNATDAIKVQRHFAGLEVLTEPIRVNSADVNFSYSINATDAIKIKRRFSGLDNFFTRGDWTFGKAILGGDTIIINGAEIIQNFYGLCVGDVNGSNVPGSGAKSAGMLTLEQNEIIKASPGDEIEIPVRVSNEANIGAISMVVGYPSHLMQIKKIGIQHGTPYYTAGNDALRMAWSETSPLSLGKDQTLMSLVVKISDQFSKDDQIRLSLNQESEIANTEGRVFDNLILTAPAVIYKSADGVDNAGNKGTRFEVYPVPNNGQFTAEITSARQQTFSIKIYNKIGQMIHEKSDIRVNGKSVQKFDLSSLSSGIYTVVLYGVEGTMARKILVNH